MMNQEKHIWENDRFQKNPFKVPEGYFDGFDNRMMDRLDLVKNEFSPGRRMIIRPWMAWASGIAASLLLGWFGVNTFYLKPLQEARFQEKIALFVDYCGDELHEGQLAGYFEENKIDLTQQSSTEVNALIQIDPDLAEEFIYETVGF